MKDSAAHVTLGLEARLRAMVEEVIRGTDLYLVDLSIRGRKGSQVVDIFIDSDRDLDVEALAEVSREVGFLLDAEDVIPGRYNLNVSSPGVERPLVLPRQFRKNLGRSLQVTYRVGETPRKITGELTGADDEGVEVVVSKDETLRIPYEDLVEAKVKLPW